MNPTHPLALGRTYGWARSTAPAIHPVYAPPPHHAEAANLPAAVDLTPGCPAVYDQLALGSCTANALAGLFQFLQMSQGLASWVPSRLFLYRGERSIEGDVGRDSGAILDDGLAFLASKGICPESRWPYDVGRFAELAPPEAWGEAYHNKLVGPVTIADGDLVGLKSRLVQGYPVAFGIVAFPGLESHSAARTGHVPLPSLGEKPIGGHAILLVGYDALAGTYRFRNSWGPSWGDRGYGTLDEHYIGNPELAADFRSAEAVTGARHG